jgi:ligand-binding sensor domain-containing protein
MKLHLPLLFGILSMLTSCKGQIKAPGVHAINTSTTLAKGDTISELGHNIMSLFEDSKGNHWFGSWESGLYKFDGVSLVHFTTQDGLPDNRVEEIQEDNSGNIYINTSKGLCRYADNSFALITTASMFEDHWQLNPNDMWFRDLEHDGSVYRFDGTSLHRLQLPEIPLGDDYIQKYPHHPSPYSIYCLYKDSHHNIWFGTALVGACRSNGKTFDWISEPDVTELHNGPANGVRSIAEDANGHFWFNSEYRYIIDANADKASGKKIYKREESIGSLDGKAKGEIKEYLSILKDNQNNLWIATYADGIWKVSGENIEHYPITVNAKNVTAFCVYQDKHGVIWVGTHESGAFKLEGNRFRQF